MNRIRAWWHGLSRRAKIIVTVISTFLVLGVIGSATAQPTDKSAALSSTPSPTEQATVTPATPTAPATASPTVAITPAPTPEPTPEPEPTPDVAFKTITLTGKGDKVVKFTIPDDAVAIARITSSGTSNFAVWTLDADGNETDLLVNEIGRYVGTHLFDTDGHSVAFKVTATGSWKIAVMPITAAPAWDPAATASGTGAEVLRVVPAASGLTITSIRHRGESNFAVRSYSLDGRELLVNEIGSYTGDVLLPNGTLLVEVLADGDWSLTPG